MTIAVDLGRKATKQNNKLQPSGHFVFLKQDVRHAVFFVFFWGGGGGFLSVQVK